VRQAWRRKKTHRLGSRLYFFRDQVMIRRELAEAVLRVPFPTKKPLASMSPT
jgi:hypothetical protein